MNLCVQQVFCFGRSFICHIWSWVDSFVFISVKPFSPACVRAGSSLLEERICEGITQHALQLLWLPGRAAGVRIILQLEWWWEIGVRLEQTAACFPDEWDKSESSVGINRSAATFWKEIFLIRNQRHPEIKHEMRTEFSTSRDVKTHCRKVLWLCCFLHQGCSFRLPVWGERCTSWRGDAKANWSANQKATN